MNKEFILDCPKEQVAATYYALENLGDFKRFTIDGLTGCMGLICVIEDEAALLVHDASDGYPYAKEKLSAFLSEHSKKGEKTHVVWTAGHTNWNQSDWMAERIPKKNISLLHGFTSISWPTSSDDLLVKERGHNSIARKSGGTLRQLTDSHREWQPDSAVQSCPICHRIFSFFHRRHHCRNCGRVVCGDCSAESSCLGPRFNSLKNSVHLYCSDCVPNSTVGKSLSW